MKWKSLRNGVNGRVDDDMKRRPLLGQELEVLLSTF